VGACRLRPAAGPVSRGASRKSGSETPSNRLRGRRFRRLEVPRAGGLRFLSISPASQIASTTFGHRLSGRTVQEMAVHDTEPFNRALDLVTLALEETYLSGDLTG